MLVNPEQLSLVSLIYSSDATVQLGQGDLDLLLEQSRANNASRGLTGALLYRDGHFLQVLEGSFVAVRGLLDTLRADGRHTNLRVLLEEPIPTRQFADWSMGFEQVDSSDMSTIPGYKRSSEPAHAPFDSDDGLPEASTASVRALRELVGWFRRTA